MKQLFDFLIEKDVEYKRNESMAQYTSVRIGGVADVIAFPNTEEQLIALVRYLRKNKIKHRLIGRMTNILPCDGVYHGVLVSTKRLDRFVQDGSGVVAECGVLTSSLIVNIAKSGFGGAEGLVGIPGSLGGMIVCNAGAYGYEIGDIVKFVRVFSESEDCISTLTRDQLHFSYRNSIFKSTDMIVLSAGLEFVPRDTDIIIQEMGMLRHRRASAQPIDYPSLGSVFKKAGGISAAQLIDSCGLKGFSVGDAQISPKHAGFIVNKRAATAAEYSELISIVKDRVKHRFGIYLEEEIEFI